MLEVSLEDAAEEIVFHDRPARLDPPPRVALGESFALDPVAARDAAARDRSTAVMSYRMRDVLLDAGTASLRWRGRVVRETASGPADTAPPLATLDAVVAVPRDLLIVVGFSAGWATHYDWLVRCLPAIDAAMNNAGPDTRLMLPPTPPAHASWLRLLRHADQPVYVAEPDKIYHLPRAEYSSLLGGTRTLLPRPARATWDRIAARVPSLPGHAAIFVAETSSPIRDPDALRRMAEGAGFAAVAPSRLSVAEQVNLFRAARIVLAPQSDALAGIAFCRPGTVVYELVPSAAPNPRFNHVAQTAGLDYHADLIRCGPDGVAEIDRDGILRRLEGIARRSSAVSPPDSHSDIFRDRR